MMEKFETIQNIESVESEDLSVSESYNAKQQIVDEIDSQKFGW